LSVGGTDFYVHRIERDSNPTSLTTGIVRRR
jgi:hypothetical protein